MPHSGEFIGRSVGRLAAMTLTAWFVAFTVSAGQESETSRPREVAPTFDARKVLNPEVLSGPGYSIESNVSLLEYRYVFRIRTSYGRVVAHGIPMLELRLREQRAINALSRMVDDPQILSGVVDTVRNTPKGLLELVTEPDQVIRRAPVGLRRMAGMVLNQEDRQAGGGTRRQLAAAVGCDPETTNPVLNSLLDNVARRREIGQLIPQVAMSAVVPGLGLLPATAEMKETIARKTPSEINAGVAARLEELGVWPRNASRFVQETNFTALERWIYLRELEPLAGLSNFSLLIERAIQADSEALALSSIEELRMLRNLDRKNPIQKLEVFVVPLARLKDGRNVLVCAADYVNETREVRDAVRAYRSRFPDQETILLLAGKASPGLQTFLEDFQITVVESGAAD